LVSLFRPTSTRINFPGNIALDAANERGGASPSRYTGSGDLLQWAVGWNSSRGAAIRAGGIHRSIARGGPESVCVSEPKTERSGRTGTARQHDTFQRAI